MYIHNLLWHLDKLRHQDFNALRQLCVYAFHLGTKAMILRAPINDSSKVTYGSIINRRCRSYPHFQAGKPCPTVPSLLARGIKTHFRASRTNANQSQAVDIAAAREMVTRVQEMFAGRTFRDSAELIREDREREKLPKKWY